MGMTLKSLKRYAIVSLYLAGSCPIGLRATEFRSAVFQDDGAWAQSIEFPAGTDDIYVSVPCIATATKLGAIRQPTCYYSNDLAVPFVRAVMQQLYHSSFRPATVDGKPMEVSAHFSVRFFRAAQKRAISVVMNHGRYRDIYGDAYVDPQRLTRLRHYPDGICAPNDRYTWLTIFVSMDGATSAPQLPEKLKKPCIDEMTKALKMMVMIPASVADKPKDAFFSHPFFGLWRGGGIVRLDTNELSP